MKNFKYYKTINSLNININFVYDEYIDLGDNNYAPSRLRAIISGLDETYEESNKRIGHKDFEIGRDELAKIKGVTSSEADKLLREAEKIFLDSKDYLKVNNYILLHLIKKVDKFLTEYKK